VPTSRFLHLYFAASALFLSLAIMCDYTMDPSGDVIFTLSNPNAPFAVWDGDEPGPFQIEPTVKPDSIAEPTPPTEDNPITEDRQPAPQDSEASPQEDSQPSIPSTEPVTFLVCHATSFWPRLCSRQC